MSNITPLTALQKLIVDDLLVYQSATAEEIGQRLGKTTRAISSSAAFLRGAGIVDDGSSSTAVYDSKGTLVGYAYTEGSHPIRWSLI